MGYLVINKDDESMRQDMRRNMRGGYRHDGYSPMMRGGGYEHGYKKGYEHGWMDAEDDDMEMRRQRDSRGRYM